MTHMVGYDSYLFKVLPEVSGCPPIVAEDKIRDAIIEICQSTSIWRKELPTFYTSDGTPTYEILMDDYEQLCQVSWGYLVLEASNERFDLDVVSEDELDASSNKGWRALEGTPKFVYMASPITIRLAIIPNQQFACYLGIFVKPTQASFEAPKWFFDQYLETIACGAKAKLLNMKGRSWYDPKAAADELMDFNKGIQDIRNAATRSHTRGPKHVAMRPLA